MTATPDLTSYHAVHTALRRGTRAIARAACELDPGDRRRAKAFARYWAGYAGEVHAHHTIEDDVMFPALVERVPVAADLIGRTDADHDRLDELMTLVGGAVDDLAAGRLSPVLADGLRELADLMDAHLAFEDADILPLFERHFTAEEYAELDDQAAKALGISKQAAFTVPFIASMLDPDVLDHVFGDAPVAFRLLLRATRRSHARLAARALGPVVLHLPVLARGRALGRDHVRHRHRQGHLPGDGRPGLRQALRADRRALRADPGRAAAVGRPPRGPRRLRHLRPQLTSNIDSKVEIEAIFEADGEVIQVGRTKGTVVATGVPFDIAEVHRWTIEDGRAVRAHFAIDTPGMLEALAQPAEG